MILYRYEARRTCHYDSVYDTYHSGSLELYLSTFEVISETKCGYWVSTHGFKIPDKWISKTTIKRYAYPTKEEALQYFIHRKQRYLKILKARAWDTEEGINKAKKTLTKLKEQNVKDI